MTLLPANCMDYAKLFLNSNAFGIVILAQDMKIVLANEWFRDAYDSGSQELEGLEILSLFPAMSPRLLQAIEAWKQGKDLKPPPALFYTPSLHSSLYGWQGQ